MIRALLNRLSGVRGKDQAKPGPVVSTPAYKENGNSALAAGQLGEAQQWFERGIQALPQDAPLRVNLGFVHLQSGRFAAAVEVLHQALALRRPGDGVEADGFYLLGCAQAGLGLLQEALASFESALAARPDFVHALESGVRAALQAGRPEQAAIWARQLAQHLPGPGADLLLARSLLLSGFLSEASQLLERLCMQAPENVEAAFLRFEALWQGGHFEAALTQAERVLELTGPDARSLTNLGFVLEKLDRLDEALARTEEALRLDPDSRGALLNRVAVLIERKQVREGQEAALQALQRHPQDADLHWNLGVTYLMLGQYQDGWREHEWRHRGGAGHEQPLWRGEDLTGRTILVEAEQGFGDNIQFVRYVPELARRARSVLLHMPPELEPLLRGLAPNCTLLRPGDPMPSFDCHCPVMSLPAGMGTTLETIPASIPYLRADPAAVQHWRERLGTGQLNVGLAWSGRPTQGNDRRRSMTLACLRDVVVPGCRFVNLLPQVRPSDRVAMEGWPDLLDAGSELRDFGQTAALMEALDLVISVCTSNAHLAGALGRPVWVMLAYVPDWRWMLEGECSPWYPTARLFRQSSPNDWAGVVTRVREALQARVATAPASV